MTQQRGNERTGHRGQFGGKIADTNPDDLAGAPPVHLDTPDEVRRELDRFLGRRPEFTFVGVEEPGRDINAACLVFRHETHGEIHMGVDPNLGLVSATLDGAEVYFDDDTEDDAWTVCAALDRCHTAGHDLDDIADVLDDRARSPQAIDRELADLDARIAALTDRRRMVTLESAAAGTLRADPDLIASIDAVEAMGWHVIGAEPSEEGGPDLVLMSPFGATFKAYLGDDGHLNAWNVGLDRNVTAWEGFEGARDAIRDAAAHLAGLQDVAGARGVTDFGAQLDARHMARIRH